MWAGRALHTLQPPGPVWVVDRWVEWKIWSEWRQSWYMFRCKAAPVTALLAIPVRGSVIECSELFNQSYRRGKASGNGQTGR